MCNEQYSFFHTIFLHRSIGNLLDSPIMVSLLEFISVFAESHLERCVSMSALSQGGNSALLPESAGVDVNMNQAVVGFFEELVATTTGTQEPELLSRIVTVWNRVLHMGSVRDSLFTQPALCVNMASHLLQCCLCSSNSNMHDTMDELIEDMTIDPLVDPHMRSILSHICDYPRTTTSSISSNSMNTSSAGNNGSTVLGAEEVNCIGTLLIRDCQTLFTELVASGEVQQWLTNTVNQLQMQHMSVIAGSNAASYSTSAVDLQLLVSLLPLLQISSQQIILQLTSLAAQLLESQFYNRGKEFAVLIATCCQMAGRLIQCNGIVTANRVDSQLVNELQQLLCSTLAPVLVKLSSMVCSNNTAGCSPTRTTYANTVFTSMCILLLQTVTVNIDVIDMDNAQCTAIKSALIALLQDQHSGWCFFFAHTT